MSNLTLSNFWFNQPNILWNNPTEFFPSSGETISEKLNSIVRLSFYLSCVLSSYYRDLKYFILFIITCIFTYFLFVNSTIETETLENTKDFILDENKTCTKPTIDNPFMNINYIDNIENPDRTSGCDITDPLVKEDVDRAFYNNLFRDTSDLFGKLNSERQFYKMPSTTIPNDQKSFMNWCYNVGPTCKENSDACYKYNDIRYNRPVYPNPFQNPFTNSIINK